MAERVTIDLVTQVGVEATPGTPVAATKQLQTIQFVPGSKFAMNEFTPSGFKYPTVVVYNKEWTESKLTGIPSYGELPYYLSAVLSQPTITNAGSSPIGKLWTFNPSSNTQDTPKVFTYEHGDALRAEQIAQGTNFGFEMKISRDKLDITGDVLGQRLTDGFALTALTPVNDVQTISESGPPTAGTFTLTLNGVVSGTIAYNATAAAVQAALAAMSNIGAGNVICTGGPLPGTPVVATFQGNLGNQPVNLMTAQSGGLTGGTAAVAHTTTGVSIYPDYTNALPLQPNQMDCFFDLSSGALGTTKFLRDFDFTYSIKDRYQGIWPLNSALSSFAAVVEKMPKVQIMGTLAADAQGMALLTALRGGTTYFVRVTASGPVLDSVNSINYGVTLDQAVKFIDMKDPKDFEGIYVREFDADMVHDPGWGKALTATVTNRLPSL